jgi:hypothetical protein
MPAKLDVLWTKLEQNVTFNYMLILLRRHGALRDTGFYLGKRKGARKIAKAARYGQSSDMSKPDHCIVDVNSYPFGALTIDCSPQNTIESLHPKFTPFDKFNLSKSN